MNENLITDNNNDNINNTIAREKILFKEVKKMTFIKYLNLFISIFRFFLMFYLLNCINYSYSRCFRKKFRCQ